MTPLARLLVGPLLLHLVAALALWARVAPPLEARLEQAGTVRHGFAGLVALLAFVPASVPSALVALVAPTWRGDARSGRWLSTAAWLVALDTVLRSVASWVLPVPVVLGDIIARVATSPDAIGRWGAPWAPTLVQALGPVAALGLVQLAAGVAAGVAFAQGRHGPLSDDPLPWPRARGVVAGLAGAVVLAVLVRSASGPATSAWLSVLA